METLGAIAKAFVSKSKSKEDVPQDKQVEKEARSELERLSNSICQFSTDSLKELKLQGLVKTDDKGLLLLQDRPFSGVVVQNADEEDKPTTYVEYEKGKPITIVQDSNYRDENTHYHNAKLIRYNYDGDLVVKTETSAVWSQDKGPIGTHIVPKQIIDEIGLDI